MKLNLYDLDFDRILKTVTRHKKNKSDADHAKSGYQRKINYVYPSGLGLCLRKQYFDAAKMNKSTTDDGLLVIFYHGDIVHDEIVHPILKYYFEEIYSDHVVDVRSEEKLKIPVTVDGIELQFRGKIDNVLVENPEEPIGLEIPVEVKSIGNRFYKLNEPDMPHQIQLMCYLGLTQQPYGFLLYVHKATLRSKTFKIEFDGKIWNGILQRAKRLYEYQRDGTIPYAEAMVEAEKGDYWWKKGNYCDGCPYLTFCLSNKEEIPNEEV